MGRLIWRFIYAFRTNNNFRLGVFWALTGILLVFNLLVFGLGPSEQPTPLSETAQRYYNLYRHGQFETDAGLRTLWGILFQIPGTFWGWLRTGFWWMFWLLFTWSLIYIPISRRDELHRAIREARRRVREHEGGTTEVPRETPPAPTTQPTTTPQTGIWQIIANQIRIFFREFGAVFLGETLFRRRR